MVNRMLRSNQILAVEIDKYKRDEFLPPEKREPAPLTLSSRPPIPAATIPEWVDPFEVEVSAASPVRKKKWLSAFPSWPEDPGEKLIYFMGGLALHKQFSSCHVSDLQNTRRTINVTGNRRQLCLQVFYVV